MQAGAWYQSFILEVTVARRPGPDAEQWSIADLLDATVSDAIEFLGNYPDSRSAQRALRPLQIIQQVGLGYLALGQPLNTLSGGESQRLKLVRHLANFSRLKKQSDKPTLFLFDEPTTGLHFDDIGVLMAVFQKLVQEGHSVLVIEHNLEVIRRSDWVIDMGPEGGMAGGQIVVEGTPAQVAAHQNSHTGAALRERP